MFTHDSIRRIVSDAILTFSDKKEYPAVFNNSEYRKRISESIINQYKDDQQTLNNVVQGIIDHPSYVLNFTVVLETDKSYFLQREMGNVLSSLNLEYSNIQKYKDEIHVTAHAYNEQQQSMLFSAFSHYKIEDAGYNTYKIVLPRKTKLYYIGV